MSQTSSAFQLTKKGSRWWAEKSYPSRGPVRIDCGSGNRADAQERASRAFYLRDIAAAGGRKGGEARRRKSARTRAAAPSELPPPPPPPPPTAPPADPPPTSPPPDPPADEPAPPAAAERFDRIRLKLLSLGDSRPIEPDAVHAPGDDPRAANDNSGPDPDDSLDNEAGELLADLVAAGVVDQHIKWIARRLKKRTPPQRPGEPNERMLDWERDGVAHYVRKLFGRATALGPFGKMVLGAGLVTLGCFVDAEPIEVARASTSTSSPPAAAAPPAAPAPDAKTAENTARAEKQAVARVHDLIPLGRFK